MSNGMQTTTRIIGFESVGGVRCRDCRGRRELADTGSIWPSMPREYKVYMTQGPGQEFRYDPPGSAIKLP